MTDNSISVTVTINAPVERVWPLLVDTQSSDKQEAFMQKYVQSDPAGPPVAGQVIHVTLWFLRFTAHIDQVVDAEPPLIGQTINARVSFLRRSGKTIGGSVRDPERYEMQTQFELTHPWVTMSEQSNTRCIPIDTTSCIIVYTEQSDTTIRPVPRWLKRLMDNDKTSKGITVKAKEAYLQKIKSQAEQSRDLS